MMRRGFTVQGKRNRNSLSRDFPSKGKSIIPLMFVCPTVKEEMSSAALPQIVEVYLQIVTIYGLI